MKKYIIKDLVYNAYYLGGGEWTICRLCAQQFATIEQAEKEIKWIIKVNKPIKKSDLKIIENEGK